MKKIFIFGILLLSTTHLMANAFETAEDFYENKQLKKAFNSFSKSCKEGNLQSCSNVGLMYALGEGVAQNIEKATKLLTKSCKKEKSDGPKVSCENLKYVQQGNRGITIWFKKETILVHADEFTLDYHEKECEKGRKQSCKFLSAMKQKEVSPPNEVKVVKTLVQKCKEGDNISCYNLAVHYDQGNGIKVDKQKANKLYEDACSNGLAEACRNIAVGYEQGDGRSKNMEKAQEYYIKACKQGDAHSCTIVGLIYNDKHNEKKAYDFYKKGCDKGDSTGCLNQGICYYGGKGIEQNKEKSFNLFTIACTQKNARACSQLAVLYYMGEGVKQNENRAVNLFKTSCQLGDKEGCENHSKLTGNRS